MCCTPNLRWFLEKLFELLQALAGELQCVKILAKRKARKDLADVGVLLAVKLAQIQLEYPPSY
jgi:hypothetical protein